MSRRELLATIVVLLVAVPLGMFFTRAVIDARVRASEAPFRAVLGNARFESLMEGEGGFPHYLGDNFAAPNFTLTARNGKPWTMSDQRGKLIVMNFWTITCKPCIQEMPTLETLALITKSWGDVEVVAVSTDPSWVDVDAVIPKNTNMTALLDPQNQVVSETFGTKLYPETWIVDKNGVVRFRFDGPLDWANPVVLDLIRAYL